MKTELIAGQLYGILKDFHGEPDMSMIPFKDLPRDYKSKLLNAAGYIHQENPMRLLVEFRDWAAGITHPEAKTLLNNFCKLKELEMPE